MYSLCLVRYHRYMYLSVSKQWGGTKDMKNTITYCYFFKPSVSFQFFLLYISGKLLNRQKKIEKFPWVAFQMLRSSGLAAQHCPKPTGHTSHCYACCSLYYSGFWSLVVKPHHMAHSLEIKNIYSCCIYCECGHFSKIFLLLKESVCDEEN